MTPAEKSYQSMLDIRRALGVADMPITVPMPTVEDHLMLHSLGVCWSGDYRD
jgi:hypothetical protein